jgi:phospholipase C
LHTRKKFVAAVLGAAAIGASVIGLSVSSASSPSQSPTAVATATPIKHVVVIYGENISFDHYFGTYPFATNPSNEPQFHAAPGTSTVNGLNTSLLEANPNENNPQRLDPSQAVTCDQNHGYSAEESAFDSGLMDKFVQDTTGGGCTQTTYLDNGSYGPNGIVMDYYDGNTVTALWNYAQHFTLNDNSYSTQFGPSTPGAINLISGQTHGATAENGSSTAVANGTDISDQDPYYDLCSNPSSPANTGDIPGTTVPQPNGTTLAMSGLNVGNLLNTKSLTWGWFEGGFTPSSFTSGRPTCATAHANVGGASTADYVQHHEPFQYYQSTANPFHVSPASLSDVGVSDPAGTTFGQAVNHQYDISWFNQLLAKGDSLPSVSFLKAPAYEDGHAGYSDPLDEQKFLVDEINSIEQSKDWGSTAIVLAYDDSDGWYDHQMGPIIRQSADTADTLTGAGHCGSPNTSATGFQNDRCGVGPRQPLLVISPWAKQNYVDSTFTEQASITQFIEDNWSLGRIGNESADAGAGTLDNAFDFNQSYGHAPAVILNDTTGEVENVIYPHGSNSPAATPVTNAGTPAATTGTTTSQSAAPADTPTGGSSTGTASTGSSSTGTASTGGSSTGTGKPTGVHVVKLPKVTLSYVTGKRALTLLVKTKGGSEVATLIRARLLRGKSLVANRAGKVRDHKVKLSLSLSRQSRGGRYTIRLSIDAGGRVGSLNRYVRVR